MRRCWWRCTTAPTGRGGRTRTIGCATLTPCSWYGVRCAGGHVIQISLYSNSLGGAIPAQLGELAGLQYLELWGNQLGGVIPPQLGDLTALKWLSLAFNQLSGAIPVQLGDLANLETLGLHANRLSGAIPAHLGDLAHLQILTLNANQFSGAIPAQLCNPPYVAVGGAPLNLGYNALTSGPACLDADDPDWAQTQTGPPTSLYAVLVPRGPRS